jgi:peptide-methionine (S)-S-oxide reductase
MIIMTKNGVNHLEKATFGAGCFWHVEQAFQRVRGVVETSVGYMGGTLGDPTYEEVCTDRTGHAEVVEVTFDPTLVTYEDLLGIFWNIHDPTTLNRQGPDRGTQYRSVIFFHSPEQKAAAEASKNLIEQTLRWERKIVTEITPAGSFFRAEEYHQKYLDKYGHTACRL